MTTVDAQVTNNTSVMLTTVAGDEYAIGYVSLGSLDESVKHLRLMEQKQQKRISKMVLTKYQDRLILQ